jgi:replicative DNA helicase
VNPALEQAQATILGGIITKPSEAATVFATLRIEDFDAQYRLIAEAIHGLRLARTNIDTLAVIDEMTRRGTLGRVGGHAEVHRVAGHFGSVDYSVEIVARHARLRRLTIASLRTQQLSETHDADPYVIARRMADEAQAIIDGIEAEGDILTPTLGEFLQIEDRDSDWVIPSLLERADRFILTGGEGLGKSTLFRQIGIMAAAGLHPFTHQPIPPQRVMFVDCENSAGQLRRALRPLALQAKTRGHDPSENVFIEVRPEGMDLTKPEDEMWLVKRVSALQPALLLTGSLYKMHTANPNDEEPARALARVLDRCRAAANCALLLAAHAGLGFGGEKRPVRPTGSSLWLRWPEFGYGMRPTDNHAPGSREVDLVPWRGDRSERSWPTRLVSGGTWPWRSDSPNPHNAFERTA